MLVQGIHFVDFSGDLQTAICGDQIDLSGEDPPRNVTVFMSSATCPRCQDRIQRKLSVLALIDQSLFSSSSASSRARMSSTVMPPLLAHDTP